MNFWNTPQLSLKKLLRRKYPKLRQIRHFYSNALSREVKIDVWLPYNYNKNKSGGYPLCVFNDGQDLYQMDFEHLLAKMYKAETIPPAIIIGIHANQDRMREYGTADWPDYKGRGDKAGLYRDFILREFIPFVIKKYNISRRSDETVLAGFSLGGLMAFDLAYAHPHIFGICGVFSGALWWRYRAFDQFAPDADRIAHERVHKGREWEGNQRFWFECGDQDETSDRNNNGVIDSIDDTLDLIRALKIKGYPDQTIRYLEIPGGQHNQATWAQAMPDFLQWALGTHYLYQD